MLSTLSKNNFYYSFLATLVYFLLSFAGILHHEVWLDEAHSFLIGRDSLSFAELLQNNRFEGHPFVWSIMLWLLTRFTHDIFFMQLLHILITSSGVFLLFYYAPFENIKKILFAFSYFIFYEYNIISRNYGICFLGITLFCILICRPKRNYILIALLLALLANIHFLALLLSVPLAMVLFLLLWQDADERNYKKNWIAPVLILLVSYFICVLQIIPPEDSPFIAKADIPLFSMKRWGTLSGFFKAFYQFPDLFSEKGIHNSNLFTSNKMMGIFFTIAFPILLAKAFLNKPLSLLILFGSGLIICLFFFAGHIQSYTVRHWGFIFLGFYATLWIEMEIDQKPYLDFLKKHLSYFSFSEHTTLKKIIVYSTLMVQAAGGIALYSNDIQAVFSHGKSVAHYLQENHYENELIILSNFRAGPAVSAYLDRKLYYPETQAMGSFCIWNTHPLEITRKEVLDRISNLSNQKQAFLVLDSTLTTSPIAPGMQAYENSKIKIQYLTRFENDIIHWENFNVYRVTYK